MIKEWFKEYLERGGKLHTAKNYDFIIYKGFKIIKSIDTGYEILDTRYNDMYTSVKEEDWDILAMLGFVAGADTLMEVRDLRRVRKFRKLLEGETLKKEKIKKNRKEYKSNADYRSALDKNTNQAQEYMDKLFFYETRIRQIKLKYNLQDEQVYTYN